MAVETTHEILRRVRAAVAYSDRPQTEIADALSVDSRTFERWKAKGIQRPNVNLPIIARECGLPEAFFYASFDRLDEIVPPAATAPSEDVLLSPRPPFPAEREGGGRGAGGR